jgi:non-ribosomal peptide synthetase component E (peptide arylation enzyme)
LRIQPFLECAVVGQEDADDLVKRHAFVALRPDVRAEGLKQVFQALARERLEPYKCPRWITLVPELPKTATGKIQLLPTPRDLSRRHDKYVYDEALDHGNSGQLPHSSRAAEKFTFAMK